MTKTLEAPTKPVARLFNIDKSRARRLDDAYDLQQTNNGWLLQIAICDVAAQVPKGSSEDTQARKIGRTIYHKTRRNTHMLPYALVSDKTSLQEGKRRQVILMEIPFTPDFQAGQPTFKVAEVEIQWNFDFPTADAIISGTVASPYYSVIRNLNNLANSLYTNRVREGAITVFEPTTSWASTEEGLPYLMLEDNSAINQINRELSILLNRYSAEFVHGKDMPMLYRNHEVVFGEIERKIIQRSLIRLISQDQETAVRQLSGPNWLEDRIGIATHGTETRGHFGLDLDVYGHFHSPLRRFVDLVNQRVLKAAILGDDAPYTIEELDEIATEINGMDTIRFLSRHDSCHEILDGSVINIEAKFNFMTATRFRKLQAKTKKEILGKIRQGLSAEEICAVLKAPKCYFWGRVKLKTLDSIKKKPELLEEVFQLIGGKQYSPVVKADKMKLGGKIIHYVKTNFSESHHTGAGWHADETLALEQAKLGLIYSMSGLRIDLSQFSFDQADDLFGDPKGSLTYYCQIRKLKPVFTFEKVKSGFLATCHLTDSNCVLTVTGKDWSLELAKQRASWAMLKKLRSVEEYEYCPKLFADGDDIVTLGKLAESYNWPTPEFDLKRKAPNYTCNCTLVTPLGQFSACACSTAPMTAKSHSAMLVLGQLVPN